MEVTAVEQEEFASICEYAAELAADLLGVPLVLLRLSGGRRHVFRRSDAAPHLSNAVEGALRCGRTDGEGVLEEEVNRSGGDRSSVRFYAGVALEGEQRLLGSLYVFDNQRRRLSESDRGRLRDMARLIAYALEAPQQADSDSSGDPPLTSTEDSYRHLMSHVSDAVFVTDLGNGRILDANKRAQRLLGRSLDELRNMHQKDLHPSDSTDLLSILPASGHVPSANLELLHRDGRRILAEVSASIVDTPAGTVVQSIFREINERRRAERLQETQEQLIEMVARGEPLQVTLEALVEFVEAQVPGARAVVSLLESGGERIAEIIAPSLPVEFAAALQDLPLGQAGPIEKAVRRETVVHSDDVVRSPEVVGTSLREMGLTRWVAAPLGSEDKTLGAFVLYVSDRHALLDELMDLIGAVQHTGGIAAARHRAERELRESEERWRSLVEHHPEAIVVHRHGRIVYGNAATAKLTGAAERKDLIGLSPSDFVAEEDLGDVEERLAVLKSGQSVPLRSYRLRDLSGNKKEVEALGVPTTFGGEPAVQTILRDVTGRRRAERDLKESERQYRLLAENVSDVIVRHDPDGTCRYISPSLERLTGRKPESLIGAAGSTNIHPDDEKRFSEALADLKLSGETQLTCRLQHVDGHYVWVETTARAVVDEAGTMKEIFSVTRDISERVEAEKDAQLLGKAVEQAIEGILVLNEDNVVEYANPAWAAMHGYDDARALVGESLRLFHTEEQMTHLVRPFQQQVRKHGAFESEMEHVHTDGTTFPTRMTVTQLEGGEFVATANDITVQKHYERQLIQAKDEAEEMSRLKSSFVGNMSHEIRTPLTGIIGLSEMIKEEAEGEYSDYVHLIEKSGRRLLETLNAVLDLAQLEGGTMELHPSRFDFAEVASQAMEPFQPRAKEKDITLQLVLPEPPVLPVEMDHSAAQRILENLVSNAVKFTDEGGVTISLQKEDRSVALTVEDTGVGIPEAFHPQLFESFQQASSGTTREYEGSGLGLAITKQLVDLIGGTIEVESTEGEGSTFTVHLPAVFEDPEAPEEAAAPESTAPEKKTSSEERAEAMGRCSVLIVEDDATTREVVQLMLKGDYDVAAASGIDAALQKARSRSFDLILLDINLGERRTGVEVMHALRELPEYSAVPMVACTAYALPGDEERFLRVGFQGYVDKPIRKEGLLRTLERVLQADVSTGEVDADLEEIDIEVPPLPGTLPEVIELASRREEVPDTEKLAQVLEKDPVVSSRVLRHVNSAAYSLSQRVSSIDRAVTMLGFDPLCDLVLTEVLKKAFADYEEGPAAVVYEHITKTSVATAVFARALAQHMELEQSGTAFSAGMLVQLGRLALLGNSPGKYVELWQAGDSETAEMAMTAPTLGQEFLHFGTDYVELGARIGRQWDLSDEILEVLRHHRNAHRRGAAYHSATTLAVAVGFTAAQNLYAPDRASNVPEQESTNALKTLEELAGASGHPVNDVAFFLEEQREEVQRFVDAVC